MGSTGKLPCKMTPDYATKMFEKRSEDPKYQNRHMKSYSPDTIVLKASISEMPLQI